MPVTVTRAELVSPELNRYLYTAVGGYWHWLDGPAALANYSARGMRAYRTEVEQARVPAEPMGPWPGAGARR